MGRKQHERITVIGSFPSKAVALAEFSSLDPQNAGTKVEYEVYAPEGVIATTELIRLRWAKLGAGVTDAYGNRVVALISNQRKIGVLYAVQLASQECHYTYGQWEPDKVVSDTAFPTTMKPIDKTAQYHAQKGVSFSDTDPLVIQFDNTSTANSASGTARQYFVRYSYEKVI
jgi:hypothetical protein